MKLISSFIFSHVSEDVILRGCQVRVFNIRICYSRVSGLVSFRFYCLVSGSNFSVSIDRKP